MTRSKKSKRSKAAQQVLSTTPFATKVPTLPAKAPPRPPPTCIPIPRLPDDTLSAIMKFVAGSFFDEPENTYRSRTQVARLQTCSLVSRLWHKITVPHLFVFIRVGCSSCLDHENGVPRRNYESFLSFLQDAPEIANAIKEARFCHVSLDVHKVIEVLPQLRRLRLDAAAPILPLTTSSTTSLERRVISKLQYSVCSYKPKDNPPVLHQDLVATLSLFSEIGELELMKPPIWLNKLPALTGAQAPNHPNLHLSSLVLPEPDTFAPRFLQFFRGIGALANLTCLSIYCGHRAEVDFFRGLNDTLILASSTLGEFHLELYRSWDLSDPNSELPSPGKETAVRMLSKGISACKSLHGFRLEMTAEMTFPEPDYNSEDPFGDEFEYPSVLEHAWLVACALISRISSGPKLKHLVLLYCPISSDGLENLALRNAYSLDWSALEKPCSRCTGLRSLKVYFTGGHRDDAECDIDKEDQDSVRYYLKLFSDAVHRGQSTGFFTCEQEGCQWRESRK